MKYLTVSSLALMILALAPFGARAEHLSHAYPLRAPDGRTLSVVVSFDSQYADASNSGGGKGVFAVSTELTVTGLSVPPGSGYRIILINYTCSSPGWERCQSTQQFELPLSYHTKAFNVGTLNRPLLIQADLGAGIGSDINMKQELAVVVDGVWFKQNLETNFRLSLAELLTH